MRGRRPNLLVYGTPLMAAQQVKSVSCGPNGPVCPLWFNWIGLSSVDGAAAPPSEVAASQEVAPLSAERRRELEHYLQLKRSEVTGLLLLQLI